MKTHWRKTAFGLACLLAVPAGLAAARPAQPDPEAGRRIYRLGILPSGRPVRGLLEGDIPVEGTAASCATCHRRSGFGGVEGTTLVPPVTGPALFVEGSQRRTDLFRRLFQEDLSERSWMRIRDPRARPAYDDETLAVALREGRDPTGRALDPLMPRYRLDDRSAAHLIAYLRTLAAAPGPGVDTSTIHFATVVTEGVDPGRRQAMLDVLTAYVRWKTTDVERRLQRPYPAAGEEEALASSWRRWALHVWELKGPAETWPAQLAARYQEQPVFAVLGGLAEGAWRPIHDFCERAGIPCLFPETELPVTSPPGDWVLYLSPGLIVEAEAVAHRLRENSPGGEKIVQVYRDGERGRAPARALRRALGGAVRLDDLVIEADREPGAAFWRALIARERPAALVLWLSGGDLTGLPASPGPVRQVFLSSTLLGGEPSQGLEELPEDWRGRALLTWRFSLPGSAGPHRYRIHAWLRARGLEPRHERLQLDTWLTLSLTDEALMHLADRFSRDLFVETIEREAERTPNPGVFPRLSLGPGQRLASKGCYLVRLAKTAPGGIEPVGGWIVP